MAHPEIRIAGRCCQVPGIQSTKYQNQGASPLWNYHEPPSNLTWETYTTSWKARFAAEQQALFAQSLAPQYVYNEHQVATQGWHEFAAYREAFHQQVRGGHFETQSFASHHRQSIATSVSYTHLTLPTNREV